jgi:membrane protease YdiL (CAAX protease family)
VQRPLIVCKAGTAVVSHLDSAMAPDAPPAEISGQTGLVRRWFEGFLFVSLWIAIGLALDLETNAYLLLGVPFTLLFQLLVRRKSVRSLWVRDAAPFRLGWVGAMVTAVLVILPALDLYQAIATRHGTVAVWNLCAAVGAFAAGYAIRHWRRSTFRPFFLCLAIAGPLGIAPFVMNQHAQTGRLQADLAIGVASFLKYFAVIFVLEEVSFRGALDSHWYHPGDRLGWLSALLGSALWGLWHLPTVPTDQRGWGTVASLIGFHTLVGVPLALFWRKSGNLAVPGFAHALIDAVRNALQAAD